MKKDGRAHHKYESPTYWDHVVAKYTNLTILDVQDLNWLDYLLYRRDAFISQMSQTDEGQKYLDKAWIYSQTDSDRQSLRDLFGKGARLKHGRET